MNTYLALRQLVTVVDHIGQFTGRIIAITDQEAEHGAYWLYVESEGVSHHRKSSQLITDVFPSYEMIQSVRKALFPCDGTCVTSDHPYASMTICPTCSKWVIQPWAYKPR